MSESITTALVGICGAVVSLIATLAVNILMHWMKNENERKKSKQENCLGKC